MLKPEVTADPPFSEADVRRQLERILVFPELQASDRRREMLRYVVEEALAGLSAQIKATTIAMAVFDRGADFDQQSDPVVRLEARKLRRDLDNYYADAGRDDPIRIDIPKGRYVPKFSALQAHDRAATPGMPMDPPEDARAPTDGRDMSVRAPRRAPLRLALAGAVLLGLLGLGLIWYMTSGRHDYSHVEIPFKGPSILVESFDANESDSVTTLVAELLAQDITSALLKFPDLRAHTAFAESETETAKSIARSLAGQALYTVHGNVWREEGQVFVRAALSRYADEELLWSERFAESERERGISAISDEISSRIASVIGQPYGIARSETRDRLLVETSNPSLRSYACIARATEYRRIQSKDLYADTRACLEETVQRQPELSRGWAMLAYLRFDATRFGYQQDLTIEEGYAQAREAAAHALTLNPRDTDALKAMSHILHFEGYPEESIDYARRAVETNPNDPETVGNLGVMLGYQGRFSEAEPLLEFTVERSISPAPRYYMFLAMAHLMREDWDDMLSDATFSAADGGSISYMLLAIANANLGNVAAARTDYLRLEERWPLLAEDPKTALKIYNVDPTLLDAFAAGLDRVRVVISD